MRFALITTFLFSIASTASSQTPQWGISISPVISNGRLPNGVGVGYAGAPFFTGNLVVDEQKEPGFSTEIFREHLIRVMRVSLKTSVGYLACGMYQHFDYDYANSINNIVSIENRFRFITFNALVKYSLPVNGSTVYVSIGPHIGYMIYSLETSTNMVNGELTTGSFNFLSNEKRINYGGQYTIGGRYKRISAEAFYRPYYKIPDHTAGRRIINFGVIVSVYVSGDRKNRN